MATLYASHPVMNEPQLTMRPQPLMNEQQLNYFRGLKNYHVLIYLAVPSSVPNMVKGSASPLTHTWLIESEVLQCPYFLVMIEKMGERERRATPLPILLITIVRRFLLATMDGRQLPSPPLLGECIRVSYFLVTIYIYMEVNNGV